MKLKHLSLSVMLIGAVSTVHASGYHFGTQSVSSQSTANASAAEASDASTIFYNAAGMTKLPGTNFSGALNLVAPSVKYSNAEAFTAPTPVAPNGTKIQGSSSGKIVDDLIAVPHLYVTHQLNDRFTAGLGIYVPFASATHYQTNSVLRYNLNETELKTIDFNPTIAFKLNDQHSFAVGVVAQYADAKLVQYANFAQSLAGAYGRAALDAKTAAQKLGAAAAAETDSTKKAELAKKAQDAVALATKASTAAQAALAQDGTGALDGHAKINGDDWGFGYTLAWLWDINENARIGVNYRSKVKHKLEGEADWTVPAGAEGQIMEALGYIDSSAKVDIDTPESLSLHGMFKVAPKWTTFADVTWTKHSRFDRAEVVYGADKQVLPPPADKANKTILSPSWKNTYKVALGASFDYSEPLQLRAGIAYDKTPVPSEDKRLATMPDNDRIWFSFGGNYKLNKVSSIDVAYSYIKIQDGSANVNGYCGGSAPREVNCVSSYTKGSADYKAYANLLGVQYNYRF
ncbi:OmpP1/FadL family transporter [Craterilacuibacter sp. RT1T]|uniref:OmpP1/FadL family transporter n=1 Tax=Craterilacuibacter sp. RT1T TaxID=2942211 RepID=UPI0020BF0637|nr:OmpP1/FadL family transporter [Craterilacuibacter sp. RT1T]MCL6263136.1 OmpP1/FadL family transporter [Craterilacuibacter sp. RT1T]